VNLVERLLHLRTGDFQRGLPLFGYYFLIIASAQIGQVVRDALFLDRFAAVRLPYVDIAVSVVIGFVIALYIRVGRRANLHDLLVGSLCFYSANLLILWWAVHFYQWSWLYVVLYVWVGAFGVLAPAQVWTLANFVWTTREAKRRFSMLGSGGITGGIFAGFFSIRIAQNFGTESLLLVMAVMLLLSALVVAVVWRSSEIAHQDFAPIAESGPRSLRDSFALILQSPHLQAIAALVCVSSMVTTTAAWQLKAIAQEAFPGKQALTIFFGQFDAFTGILALGAQLFLTGPLLHRFGIGVALSALPLSLLSGSALMIFSGTLWAACLVKGSDRVFRYSLDTSAQQLLYLPVASRVKFQVKSFIDTVVWRLGGGLAGVLLLIFATNLGLSASEIGWLNIVLVGVWLVAAFVARHQYIATLGRSIRQFDLDVIEGAPLLDRSSANILLTKLKSPDADEILHALELFEMGQHTQVYTAVRDLLDHPSGKVRAKAIAILNSASDTASRGVIAGLLHDEDLTVRTEALSYLSTHDHIDPLTNIEELGKFADFSICSATVAFLARPGESQNLIAAGVMLDAMVNEAGEEGIASRRAAARLIASLPDHFESQLARLMEDSDKEVVRGAIEAVAALHKRKLVPALLERSLDPDLGEDAVDALATFQNTILGTLQDHMNDPAVKVELRRAIPEVLLRIGTLEAARTLAENLLQVDSILRYRITVALNKLQELHRDLPLDRGFIETIMVAEIMGHYRSYQIYSMLRGYADGLFKTSIDREVERIFRLMKLLFPTVDFENAYRGIRSSDPVAHANALEFLDNTLSPTLRSLVLPVIDSEISAAERIRLADSFLNTQLTTREEAVAALVHTEDPWLKSCAAYAIRKLGLTAFQRDVDRWVADPDPFLRKRLQEAGVYP
jgi:AAA family ATP:ADP antiporter